MKKCQKKLKKCQKPLIKKSKKGKRKQKGGDLQSSPFISTILRPFTTQKYKGERHFFKHNYTGPGTRLDLRLDENNKPKPGEEPVNRVDAAALKHDIAYKSDDLRDRHKADVEMIHDLNMIQNPTPREKKQIRMVKLAMKGKLLIGQ